VINERDILGTQLIRRNDELALLYEKLKIQQSTLRKVCISLLSFSHGIDTRAYNDLIRQLCVLFTIELFDTVAA
jgi:hypothetical protein